jgi:hypothetical protein
MERSRTFRLRRRFFSSFAVWNACTASKLCNANREERAKYADGLQVEHATEALLKEFKLDYILLCVRFDAAVFYR